MSNYLAVATVSAALRSIINGALLPLNWAGVQAGRPDAKNAPANFSDWTNIFLYMVTTNAAYRNLDLPARGSDGQTLLKKPWAALDLHYLITFYGQDESEFRDQQMLGKVMATLENQPILSRGLLKAVINDPQNAYLAPPGNVSDLDQSVELVRFTPNLLGVEELTKLWSIFFETPYAPSIAYQASVILLEADGLPQSALPVRKRRVFVNPIPNLQVDSVTAAPNPQAAILAGGQIAVGGQGLAASAVRVRLNGIQDLIPDQVSDSLVLVTLPNPDPSDLLRAGALGLQVVHSAPAAEPAILEMVSNLATLVLRPQFAVNSANSSTITLKNLRPRLGKRQQAVLLLTPVQAPSIPPPPPLGFSFAAPPDNGIDALHVSTDVIAFDISAAGLAPGDYLIRLQVDGAQSQLDVNNTPGDPHYQEYLGTPKVTL